MNMGLRVGVYAAALSAAVAYAVSPVRVGVVVGNSMMPSLHAGSPYLMTRVTEPEGLQRGDVVVFRKGGTTYIKRILGVPGDVFYVVPRTAPNQEETLVHDWEMTHLERLIKKGTLYASFRLVQRKVPAGRFYVVGDHLAASEDSRSFGPIEADSIIGSVIEAPVPRPEFSHVARIVGVNPV